VLNAEIFRDAYNRTGGTLMGLAQEVEKAGFWQPSYLPSKPKTIEEDVQHFNPTLLAHILLADRKLSPGEHDFVKVLLQQDISCQDSHTALTAQRDKHPCLLREIPAFLQAAINCDIEHGTNYGTRMVALIEQLANLVISSDRQISPAEAGVVASYIQFLTNHVASAGSPTAESHSQSDSPSRSPQRS
jgi:uncharacterized tellurite resistance protein B-like protein